MKKFILLGMLVLTLGLTPDTFAQYRYGSHNGSNHINVTRGFGAAQTFRRQTVRRPVRRRVQRRRRPVRRVIVPRRNYNNNRRRYYRNGRWYYYPSQYNYYPGYSYYYYPS